jgi:hypothetical protein
MQGYNKPVVPGNKENIMERITPRPTRIRKAALAALTAIAVFAPASLAAAAVSGTGPSGSVETKTTSGVVMYQAKFSTPQYRIEDNWDVVVSLRASEPTDRLSGGSTTYNARHESRVAYQALEVRCSNGQPTGSWKLHHQTKGGTVDGATERSATVNFPRPAASSCNSAGIRIVYQPSYFESKITMQKCEKIVFVTTCSATSTTSGWKRVIFPSLP